jgi:hypothetical protein
MPLGEGWRLGASARGGRTRLDLVTGGLVAGSAPLTSFAFAFDVAKAGVLRSDDRLALRISQPLRVEAGGLHLDVPADYDYASGATRVDRRFAALVPSGRELDVEAAWSLALSAGSLDANLYWRQDPGHIDALADDVGAALRFTTAF